MSALRNLAWLLATGDDDSVRDGARAMDLAQQAIGLSTESRPDLLHVLAAAYAETGRFAEADETAERALALSLAQDDAILVNLIRKTRNAYQAGRPFRDRNASSTDSPATP
jgi:tetratricopeptide (TPR) repeat protein